jgi:hypothetical protein
VSAAERLGDGSSFTEMYATLALLDTWHGAHCQNCLLSDFGLRVACLNAPIGWQPRTLAPSAGDGPGRSAWF